MVYLSVLQKGNILEHFLFPNTNEKKIFGREIYLGNKAIFRGFQKLMVDLGKTF